MLVLAEQLAQHGGEEKGICMFHMVDSLTKACKERLLFTIYKLLCRLFQQSATGPIRLNLEQLVKKRLCDDS